MANISNVTGNIPLIKKGYKKFLSYGEHVTGDEFVMSIEGYPDLQYLIATTQIPPLQRTVIEGYGPHGVKFNQQGNYVNAQDIPFSVQEVITGKAYEAFRDIVKNKKYVTVKLGIVSESQPEAAAALAITLEDCWFELEGVDLSIEDGATFIKPSGTIHANWVGHLDDETTSMSLGG